MNGYFRLVNREGASLLKLFPPTGEGKPIDVGDVVEYLTMKDYACDLSTIKKAVENAGKEPQEIRIGNETRLNERECYKLTVRPDKMQAYARFFAASEGGEDMTAQEMIHDLELRGIKCGILTDAIEGFLSTENTAKTFWWRRAGSLFRAKTLISNIGLTPIRRPSLR